MWSKDKDKKLLEGIKLGHSWNEISESINIMIEEIANKLELIAYDLYRGGSDLQHIKKITGLSTKKIFNIIEEKRNQKNKELVKRLENIGDELKKIAKSMKNMY